MVIVEKPVQKNNIFKKIIYVLGWILFIGSIVLGESNTTPVYEMVQPTIKQVQSSPGVKNAQIKTIDLVPVQASSQVTRPNTTNLSNDNYYVNAAGNTVHSPAYADSVPAGASARCRDGTYSFSQSRRGTCSHHGGVAEWL